jgi:hypothetical protein
MDNKCYCLEIFRKKYGKYIQGDCLKLNCARYKKEIRRRLEMGQTKKDQLTEVFTEALNQKENFIAVKVTMPGCEGHEVIVNPFENIEFKLDYYRKIYNDNLEMEKVPGLAIVGWAYGESYAEICDKLM